MAQTPSNVNLLVLLFDGFEPLDADGPICMLASLPEVKVTTFAEGGPRPVTSSTGKLIWLASAGIEEAISLAAEGSAMRLGQPGQPPCSAGDHGQGSPAEGRKETWLLV